MFDCWINRPNFSFIITCSFFGKFINMSGLWWMSFNIIIVFTWCNRSLLSIRDWSTMWLWRFSCWSFTWSNFLNLSWCYWNLSWCYITLSGCLLCNLFSRWSGRSCSHLFLSWWTSRRWHRLFPRWVSSHYCIISRHTLIHRKI